MNFKGRFSFGVAALFIVLGQEALCGSVAESELLDRAMSVFEARMISQGEQALDCDVDAGSDVPYFKIVKGHPTYGDSGLTLTSYRCENQVEHEMGFAFLKLSEKLHIAQLRSFGVRGQGIGRGLVTTSIYLARELGYEEVTVFSNASSVGFYERLGFLFGSYSPLGLTPMYFSLR